MKLHLGCGHYYIDGFINIDIDKKVKKDMKIDCTNMSCFDEKVVDEIYACHILEDIKFNEIYKVLCSWVRILKPEGILKISVPDSKKWAKAYVENDYSLFSDVPQKLLKDLYGNIIDYKLDNITDSHKFISFILWHGTHSMLLDFDLLKEILEKLGLKDIQKFESTEKDASQYKHSLNIMGIKKGKK